MPGDKLKLEYTDAELENMPPKEFQKTTIKILVGISKALFTNGKEGALDKVEKMHRAYKIAVWIIVFLITTCWAWMPKISQTIKILWG